MWRRGRRSIAVVLVALAAAIGLAVALTSRPVEADSGPVVVHAVTVATESGHTTLTLSLSRRAPIAVFTLADPNRLVIDLPATRFDAAATSSTATGLVGGWRAGAAAGDRGRVVFDLGAPAKIAAADLSDEAVPRLVVDLVTTTAAEMRAAVPLRLGAGEVATNAPAGRDDAVAGGSHRRLPVIVIDPGHGGIDVGTSSPATGTPEKAVVLETARVLARTLAESGRYDVRLTRESDVYVGLGQRVAFARGVGADLFVSVHADAEYDHSVRGATVYTLAEKASDERAAALAAKENAADAAAGGTVTAETPEVGDILADLTLRETRRFSLHLARDILDEYRRHGRLVKGAAHRQASLRVLRAHDIPSVLVEIGFLSNKEDEALMTSPEWREQTARSLAAAIDRFFAGRGVPGEAVAGALSTHAAASP